ncbi:inorganic phosphate transporter Pho88 [Catenaria anguillulae PL171]|uniref:Inorganic phosphate transporter Pho88 n=1 Tax=Catenaria anguillulae PL171 TaxID=765915 RepID=A0A1Y2I6A8_9FUNG|nr:inorganic phosphate transporter Pho88 [Catenaria anguillulae PL171]
MSGFGAIANFAFVMGIMQAVQYFKIGEGENHLLYIRIAYAASQILVALAIMDLKRRIIAKNDETKMSWRLASAAGGAKVFGTIKEYDLEQQASLMKQHLTGAVLITAIHLWGGYLQPILLQVFMPWKTFATGPLFSLYYLGKPAEGDLKRPFAQQSPFGGLVSAPEEGDTKAEGKKAAVKDTKKTK